eukprot:symbB.v1.2.038255.t1/scaffold5894.1/size22671/2
MKIIWLLVLCRSWAEEAEKSADFSVQQMLQSAAGVPDLPATCVNSSTAAVWYDGFTAAVDTMMQRTKRTMQLGLTSVAKGVLMLTDEMAPCGDQSVLHPLRDQAMRLKVLASTRSLAGLDSTVRYEPLKSLSVGGIDVHLELNALLVAWRMNHGPEAVGQTLARFLADFSEDAEDSSMEPAPEAPEAEATAHGPGALQRTPGFWVALLNSAFRRLKDESQPVSVACVAEGTASLNADKLDEAFGRMMQKTQRSMQHGLKILALAVDSLLLILEEHIACQQPLRSAVGPAKLRAAAGRLETLVGTRSLINPGTNVKYEAKQMLKVGAVDVHLELNNLITAWIKDKSPEDVGVALAEFFEDFREEEEEDTGSSQIKGQTTDLSEMLVDAVSAAGGCPDSSTNCFVDSALDVFASEVDHAIEHMLKKRRKTMQQGLKELSDAVDKVFASSSCQSCMGFTVIQKGARKVKQLTRKMVVDYGTYIKYEALKSLEVGGVAVHSELNAFLSAWKLRGVKEAGKPLGILFQRFSTITGHDEF